MQILKELQWIEKDKGKWTYFEDFFQYLKKNHTKQDVNKSLLRSNVLRELQRHSVHPVHKNDEEKELVSLLSVLRYIFSHTDSSENCQKNAFQFMNKVTDTSNNDKGLLLDLYKVIITTELKTPFSISLLEHIAFEHLCIPSLHSQYKTQFSSTEWNKICFFEYHFSTYIHRDDWDFEKSLKQKWRFFQDLKSSNTLAKEWLQNSNITIKTAAKRFQSASISTSVNVQCALKHFPIYMDSFLFDKISLFYPDKLNYIVCATSSKSELENKIEVYVEIASEIVFDDLELISARIATLLAKEHSVIASRISFFTPGSFTRYVRHNNQIARFTLRDDISLKHLMSVETFVPIVDTDTIDVEGNSENGNCVTCFSQIQVKPLCIQEFNIIDEWLLNVPLSVQIVLENFINKGALDKAQDQKEFYRGKLLRLYALHDTLLNTLNKNHLGLLQKNNTDELLLNYHSINSIFAITSSFGITSSLRTGEKILKERAIDDNCYFHTYLKGHPLRYNTEAGVLEKSVTLKECYLILMLDNLVRLRYHSDPNPGDSRTMQICTLPITIQGVPKDSSEIQGWHNPAICDGSRQCPCKKSKQLCKEDVESLLFNLLPEEEKARNQFSQLCSWGGASIWKSSEYEEMINVLPPQCRDEVIALPQENIENVIDTDVESFNNAPVCSQSTITTSEEIAETVQSHEEIDVHEEDDFEDIQKLLQDIDAEEINEIDELEDLFTPLESVIYHSTGESQVQFAMDTLELETSIANLSIDDREVSAVDEPIPCLFNFHKFTAPPLITRHPPPATGRDDDINKLREVLDDILIKLGINPMADECDKILFGPDNKIGTNLLKLIYSNEKYKIFIPEFPLLHLRKSKITILFSSYKNAGLLHLLMYMTDNDKQEWSKLITAQHIDVATKYVRRLSLSLHMAFLIRYIGTLDDPSKNELLQDLNSLTPDAVAGKWNTKFSVFLDEGSNVNATFALHRDIMNHCDEVLAVFLAERLGGECGYNLLLSAVKSSLLFGYVNGATAYAPFCTKLLIEHYSASFFHKKMKASLYSTPIGNSQVNFSGDTKREMDHQDIMKSFRSGSNLNAVLNRMSLIDPLNEARQMTKNNSKAEKRSIIQTDQLGWKLTEVDKTHAMRVVKLVLRTNALSLQPSMIPYNMYTKEPTVLPITVLDATTVPVAKYLMERFLVKENLCEYVESDIGNIDEICAPREFKSRVKRSKGVTIRRSSQKAVVVCQTEREQKEHKRKRLVVKEGKQTDRLSSEMNTCQALVKPDCSKPKVQKSKGIQKAIFNLINANNKESESPERLMLIDQRNIPKPAAEKIRAATVEFAGVKFKTPVCSGEQYIKYVENSVIKSLLIMLPNVSRLVLCEEKYSFTPDDFKAATRQQRLKTPKTTITHLKTGDDILSLNTFSKEALVTTAEGKSLISTYLAANAKHLDIKSNLVLDIDSELNMEGCSCNQATISCECNKYSVPVRCIFSKCANPKIEKLQHIQQCKGEAEMAQVDWLFDFLPDHKEGDAMCSIVSSGDIDAVVIHLFALSAKWPRKVSGKFICPVYVVLQKPKKVIDFYDITGILEILEERYEDRYIGMKIAVSLCLGGNDFVPKMYGQAHDKIVKTIMANEKFLTGLFCISLGNTLEMSVDSDHFVDLIKHLYCPKKKSPDSLTFDEVREISIFTKRNDPFGMLASSGLRNAQSWMPPESAVLRLCDIVNLQVLYLVTAGDSAAPLPNFLGLNCLQRRSTGEIEYDFGDDAKVDIETLVSKQLKRKQEKTPQKGQRRKKQMTSTPIKAIKN